MARPSYRYLVVRREWGSGSIYAHGERWRVAISAGRDPFGKRIRQEWQCRTEEAAEAKLKAVSQRLDRGLPAEENRVTLAAYAQDWLAAVKPSVRPSTFSFYRTLAEAHLADLDHVPVVRISPAHVRQLIAARIEDGYASRTVRGVVDVLRMILKQAQGDGIVDRNVAELVRLPKLEQAEPRHFAAAEARRFLEVAKDDPLHSLFAVALGTGLRRGELLALVWRDIDLARHSVSVRRSKTAAGVRVVPLPAFAVEALMGLDKRPGPLWLVSPWTIGRRLTALCDRAGLPRIGMHGLRHSCASLLYAEGVPDFVVQAILGHTRVSMTKHYTHIDLEQQRAAMAKLARAVG